MNATQLLDYNELRSAGILHDEAELIASLEGEEIGEFVENCEGDVDCLPTELKKVYISLLDNVA
jgi:hypothetical protein